MSPSSALTTTPDSSITGNIEWVTPVYFADKIAKKSGREFYLIVGVTDKMERRKIYVDSTLEEAVCHIRYAVEQREKIRIPIEPKPGMEKGFRVALESLDVQPPAPEVKMNYVNKLLLKQAASSKEDPALILPKAKQSFMINHKIIEKAQKLAIKQKTTKSELYSRAVARFIDIEELAEEVGI